MGNTLLFLLLLLSPFAFCLDYTFSLNYSFLLRNDYMGITSATRDIGNQLLMFLQNNEMRRYSTDLTSYTVFNTPDLVFKSSSDTFTLSNVPLSNGTSFNIQGKVTTTISRTFTTVKTYTYPNFTLLSDYQGTQTVIDYKTIALQSPSVDTPINIIIGSFTVKVYYRNQIMTVFDYGQIFAAGVACKAAKFYQQIVSYGTDLIGLTVKFYVALDNNKVIDLTIVLSLEFNFSSHVYGLYPFASYAQIISLASPATNIFFENGILIMQSGNGQISAYDSAGGASVIVDANIPMGTLREVIFKDGRWYFLQNSQLIQVIYEVGFSLLSSIASYPGKQYNLVMGFNFDLIYVSGESYLYKMGYCLGQTYFDGVGCSNYSCFDTMCTNCWLHFNPCGVCNPGYPRTDNYQCLGSPPNMTANSIPTNSTNSTNSTIPTNTTPFNNTNNSSLSLITTFMSGQRQNFMIFLSNILKFSISLPSGRRIMYPLFYFFGNFDDIYLYSFHDAFYGRVAEGLFSDISDIQDAKWSIIERWDILSFIFGQDSQIRKKVSYRSDYLSYRYHLENKVGESQGLFCNSYDFFLFSLPVSIVFFLLLRAAYKCSQGYSISQIFRMFSLWGFLFILNFDGNIQQFTFYFFAEIKNISFFSLFQKMMTIWSLLFGFIIIAISFGGYLVGLLIYRKLNSNLIDNNRNSMRGNIELLFQNCMRNFILGAAHSVLRYSDSRYVILSSLLVMEVGFQGLFVVEATRQIFKILNKFWFYSLISFTRIILIVTFLFQHRSHDAQLLQLIQITLILANVATYLLSILFLLAESIFQIFQFLLILFNLNKSVQSTFNLHQKTIKSRIFTLSKIAQQNRKRTKPNIFQTNLNKGKSILSNQSKNTQL